MKKITLKKLAAFFLSVSLSVMNSAEGYAAGKNDIPDQKTEDESFQEIRMISVEGETSEYGERSVRFVDENGKEIIQELVPRISAGGTFAFYSLSSLMPSRYDLREQDQLPAVRNQYDTGTCWAHAALASAETNLIKKRLADTSVDLSEAHLVWFGNCSASTDAEDPLYNEGWNYGTAGYDDIGSYSVNAAGVLARGTAIDPEHFPDGSFRDYISANIDKDSDGFLSEKEISDVSDIDVDSTGIASLKGIEYFTELVSLSCGNNSLISLDLSENKKLSILSCESNLRNLGEPSCGAWVTLGIDTDKITDLNGAEIKNGIIIPDDTTITYSFDCGNNFTAPFTILADTSHSYQITPSDDPVYHNVICSVCGDESPVPHSYGEWKNTDADTFVRICSDCEYEHITTSEYHDFGLWSDNGDGTHSRSCTDCGFTETSEHLMTSWSDNDDGSHSRSCNDCGFTETSGHVMTPWSDNGDGTHSRSCTDCGFTETSGHVMTPWSDNGDSSHSCYCADCGFTETSGHVMTPWSDNGDSSHSCYCADCGFTETSEHVMTPWSDNGDGTHSCYCADCGFTETSGHNFGDWVTNIKGFQTRECELCGCIETEIIEFIRGDLNGDNIIDAFDMVLLRRAFISSFDNKSALPAADINNDGQFSIADLVSLQRYILGFTD